MPREYTRVPIEQRFWAKVAVVDDGCWLWTANCKKSGYGQLSTARNSSPALAHRVSWEIHYGPIPDGLFVLHSCDVQSCVRPDHLFLGSAADNTRDMLSKGRQAPPPGAKLSEDQVRSLRRRAAAGESERSLAREYGLKLQNARLCIRRESWRHVD